jgi:hypothetical protein
MRKLVLILIAFIAVVTFIRSIDADSDLAADTPSPAAESRLNF